MKAVTRVEIVAVSVAVDRHLTRAEFKKAYRLAGETVPRYKEYADRYVFESGDPAPLIAWLGANKIPHTVEEKKSYRYEGA